MEAEKLYPTLEGDDDLQNSFTLFYRECYKLGAQSETTAKIHQEGMIRVEEHNRLMELYRNFLSKDHVWCVARTELNKDAINGWANSNFNPSPLFKNGNGYMSRDACWFDSVPDSHYEITFEQFELFVLKTTK